MSVPALACGVPLIGGVAGNYDQSPYHPVFAVPGLGANGAILARFVGSDNDANGGLPYLGVDVRFRTSLDLPHVNDLADILQFQGKDLSRSDRDIRGLKAKIVPFDLDRSSAVRQLVDSRRRCMVVVVMSVLMPVRCGECFANRSATQHPRAVVRIIDRCVSLNPGCAAIAERHRTMRFVKGAFARSVLLEVGQQSNADGLEVAPRRRNVVRLRDGPGGRDGLGILEIIRKFRSVLANPVHRVRCQRFLDRYVIAHQSGGCRNSEIVSAMPIASLVCLIRIAAARRKNDRQCQNSENGNSAFCHRPSS